MKARLAVRAKVGGSGLLLLVTGAYHASGSRALGAELAASSLSAELTAALGALWLFFSWHLLVIGLGAVMAALSGAGWLRPVLLFGGAVTIGDFLWVLSLAGWFPGTVLLLLAGFGLLVGGYAWRH